MSQIIIDLLSKEKLKENDLSKSAELFIALKESADLEECEKIEI